MIMQIIIIRNLIIILILLFWINSAVAFQKIKMTDAEIIKKFNLEKRIAYNWIWWEMKTFLTKTWNEVVYYNWKISKEYKNICDGRYKYDKDNAFKADFYKREDIFSRVSANKEDIIFCAKKLNWKNVIVKNFVEWPEFDFRDLNEYKFFNNNSDIIYVIENKDWSESIYINDKFIYKRNNKLNNELVVSDNWIYIIWDRDKDWKVILNYNWKIIKTNFFNIDKILISKEWDYFWGLISSKKDWQYNKLMKNWKIILDLTKFLKDWLYWFRISEEWKLYGYILQDDKSYLIIDNNLIEIKKWLSLKAELGIISNIINYWNWKFFWILIEKNWEKKVLYIYDSKTDKIRYSKKYLFIYNLSYINWYLFFNWWTENNNCVYVYDLVEYNLWKDYLSEYQKLKSNKVFIRKYFKIIKKINWLISKLSFEKLKKMNEKLAKIDLNDKKYMKHKDLIFYIKAQAFLRLLENK